MASLMDYLDWRGDLGFDVSPFNEVDNYICCMVGTPDYEGIVPGPGRYVPIAAATEAYRELHGQEGETLGLLISPSTVPMVCRLPATRRFGALMLGNYRKRFDEESAEQFSALTIALPDGSYYIAFRGTDDTLVGWKEDFLLGVQERIPAQDDALRYLAEAAELCPGPLRVGGHSKGGNLAVYAAIHAEESVQRRILAVYSNDGPGFRTPVEGTEGYERIRERLHLFLPQHSLVGTLLHQIEERRSIVRSNAFGAWAHDGFTWEVLGTAFVRCESLSMTSRAFADTMQEMTRRMEEAEMRAFVDALFDVLSSTGAFTLTDLSEHKLRQAVSLVRESRRAPEVQKFLVDLLEVMAKEYAEEVREARPELKLPWRRKD